MMGEKEAALDSFQRAFDIFPIPKYRYAVEALSKNGNGAEQGDAANSGSCHASCCRTSRAIYLRG
jgi:hypothetical protein